MLEVVDMSWKKLDPGTARLRGAANAEDVILVICADCPKGNLDFSKNDFCDVQAVYGFDGEHEAIQYNDAGGFDVRCTEFEKLKAQEIALYEKRMRGDWS